MKCHKKLWNTKNSIIPPIGLVQIRNVQILQHQFKFLQMFHSLWRYGIIGALGRHELRLCQDRLIYLISMLIFKISKSRRLTSFISENALYYTVSSLFYWSDNVPAPTSFPVKKELVCGPRWVSMECVGNIIPLILSVQVLVNNRSIILKQYQFNLIIAVA